MHSNKIRGNALTYSIVSSALLKQCRAQESEHFITQMRKDGFFPRKGMWDTLIRGVCNAQKDPERAFLLLQDLRRNHGISPSAFTFYSLVFHFCCLGMMDRAIEVLELMVEAKMGHPFDDFVSSSIISGFCKIGKPELALGFYENAIKNELFRPNVVTYTAVVVALCREGRVSEVNDLVCRMEKEGVVLDAVLYSSWIYGYFQEGLLEEAFRKHRLMVESGIKPDFLSYTILIDGFCKEGNVEKAVGFLNEMKRRGLVPNLVTYTTIIRGFCKKGKLEEAFTMFQKVEELGIKADEVVYAVLIDGLCQNGDFGQVFSLLEEMEGRGVSAGIVTFNTVINGLCKVGKMHEADNISKGISGDNFTYSTLIHGYLKEGNVGGVLETKRRLEEAGLCMDIVTCNLLIKALFIVGRFEDAYILFQGMPEMGLVADSSTFFIMIDGYCRVGRIDEALKIFDECRRTVMIPSAASYNCIIQGLCSEDMIDMAVEVFGELIGKGLEPDPIAYMTLIKAEYKQSGEDGILKFLYRIEELDPEIQSFICNDAISFLCKKGCFETASNVYIIMRRKGSVVTGKNYYLILKWLIRNGSKQLVQLMLNAFLKGYGFSEPRMSRTVVLYLCKKNVTKALHFLAGNSEKNTSLSVLTAVIDALTKEGRVQDACKLVMEVEEAGTVLDVVVYAIVVDGLCKEGYPEEALNICASMRKKGINPNIVTYNSVIHCLCRKGHLVEAFRLFDSLEQNHMLPTVVTYAILIGALSEEGFLQDAYELFKRMVLKGLTPSTRVYNLLINGYCHFGLVEDALKLLLDLEGGNLQPDAYTVSALISGYCRKGDMESALGFFGEFKRKGFLPDFLGFVNLIRGLCAKGRMEEARSVLREMLQSQSVTELINKAGDEIKMESLTSFLGSLCEQGSILEAAKILSEVGVMFFPLERSARHSGPLKLSMISQKEGPDMGSQRLDSGRDGTCQLIQPRSDSGGLEIDYLKFMQIKGKEDNSNQGNYSPLIEKPPLHNFGAYYSIIASLCSKGKLQKANTVAKEMLLDLEERR
ncbi:hypothetical protein MRB53_013132 [Persea americana]|uniref:Uncharacterized protein n=1 Tax=Persea americana TaxID=3435 RepID=A0ACC2K775_PERAE|nr:hypothetical protein MRB53_013132 [Persea americana]